MVSRSNPLDGLSRVEPLAVLRSATEVVGEIGQNAITDPVVGVPVVDEIIIEPELTGGCSCREADRATSAGLLALGLLLFVRRRSRL